nr:MAG TPA: hypothetical protein [Caudoviricetes sp.]
MGFKAQRGIGMPYRQQGRIYFTLVNYQDLPKSQREKIDRLIADAAGGDAAYIGALRDWLLRDDSNVQRVSMDHYISIQTLCRMREKVYKRW